MLQTCAARFDVTKNLKKIIILLETKALFRCEIFLDFVTIALSFVCGKYCPIID